MSFKTIFYNWFLPQELPDKANTTENEQVKCSIKAGDVFLTRTSETADELGMSSVALNDYPFATFNGFSKRLRMKTDCEYEIYPKYMGYFLRSSKFRNQINSMSIASTRASLNIEMINRLTVDLPNIDIQKKIGDFLYLIDSKIKNNEDINRNLTEQDIAIVQELSERSVNQKALKEICDEIMSGGTPSRKKHEYWNSNDYIWFKNGEIKNNILIDSEEHISKSGLEGSSAKLLPVNSILFAMYCVSTPQLAININECTTNQAVCAMIIQDFDVMCYIYYYMMYYGNTLTNLANGAAQQNLNKGMIEEFVINFPELEDIKSSPLAGHIRYKMELTKENDNLVKLRDNLLPKLMSGELDVSDLDI